MARRMPADRFDQLVQRATQVFIDLGYRRTQMADVAEALGVAKGTLYLYVESKEALFDLVVRCADAGGSYGGPNALPIRTPKPGATLRYVRERLTQNQPLPVLARAVGAKRVVDIGSELDQIVRELYTTLNRNRTAIRLIDRCAHDYPDLAGVWFEAGRGQLRAALATYLTARRRQGLLGAERDPQVLARLIIETVATWAVHRYWDPSPQSLDDRTTEDTVVAFIVNGVLGKEP
jgi:AcrR family transcriptional regulator